MATPRHTPKGRGYDTSLNYFEHKVRSSLMKSKYSEGGRCTENNILIVVFLDNAVLFAQNDFWTQACMQSACCPILTKEEESSNSTTIYDLWDTDRPARNLTGADFEEFVFQRRMLEIIDLHAAKVAPGGLEMERAQQPLFLFYAPHVAHCPLQVPKKYLDQFDWMDDDEDMCKAQTHTIVGPDDKTPKYSCRKQYHAMVKLLDDILGSLVERLKYHSMRENTLMIVTSDNGGPVKPDESAATNFPLRGGKYTDFEGGVRAVAFVSGGLIPPDRRGKKVTHPIHICDWYATTPALAGIDVHHEEGMKRLDDKRIPPADAIDVWPQIMGAHGNTGSEKEIPLSQDALIRGDFKLF